MGQTFQTNETIDPTAIFAAILLKALSGGKNGFQEKPCTGAALWAKGEKPGELTGGKKLYLALALPERVG